MIHLAQEERNKTFTDDNTMRWDSGEVRRREAPPRQRKHPRKPPKRKGTGAGYYVTILVISAILAGVGAGIYPSVEEGCRRVIKKNKTQAPNPDHIDKYEAFYRLYVKLYPSLKDNFKELATL